MDQESIIQAKLEYFLVHTKEDIFPFIVNIIFKSFIKNNFFPWLLLVLFLNRNKWKRSVIYLLIAFWLTISIGKLIYNFFYTGHHYLPINENENNAYQYVFWFNTIYGFFIFMAEIVGDWYLLIRTKAILRNQKIPVVYMTCILYNISKAVIIIYNIFSVRFAKTEEDEKEINRILIIWTIMLLISQITNIFYDISIIYYLKKDLFNHYKKNKVPTPNKFIEKLKWISEYRIIASIIISFILIFFYAIKYIALFINKSVAEMKDIYGYDIREALIYFNYYFMYIDQILLRFYVERNNPKFKISSTNSNMFRGEVNLNLKEISSTLSLTSIHSNEKGITNW
ncbi:hypothetical protein PIROE2DRAFT_17535 [Piromyces sp. E2]|nr:hypothetical protein PIROE2DRAFT_17535 [Piromyces sp. E2]|eukprot:OUM57473.1 hypothetical protein PIROE2DRAFT_17535 [Piromyces sp. E2]